MTFSWAPTRLTARTASRRVSGFFSSTERIRMSLARSRVASEFCCAKQIALQRRIALHALSPILERVLILVTASDGSAIHEPGLSRSTALMVGAAGRLSDLPKHCIKVERSRFLTRWKFKERPDLLGNKFLHPIEEIGVGDHPVPVGV